MWHANSLQLATDPAEFVAQLAQHLFGVEKGVLVIEQHFTVADRDHVVVKHALINHRRVLLPVHNAFIAQAMQARHRS